MEYYYATKRQILTFATIGIHLKDIMLCEISQTKTNTIMVLLKCDIFKKQTNKTNQRQRIE